MRTILVVALVTAVVAEPSALDAQSNQQVGTVQTSSCQGDGTDPGASGEPITEAWCVGTTFNNEQAAENAGTQPGPVNQVQVATLSDTIYAAYQVSQN